MTDLTFLTIAKASNLIAHRKLSPVELTEAYLARIEALDHLLDSFVTLTAERARAEVKTAEATIMASGPGQPHARYSVLVSRTFTKPPASMHHGDVQTASPANVPTRDSFCQEKLVAAGAVLLGKNATWEFAHGGPSWDVLFPPARNPWESGVFAGRFIVRIRRGDRGGVRSGHVGQRYGRFDPRARGCMRDRRPETDLRTGQPPAA